MSGELLTPEDFDAGWGTEEQILDLVRSTTIPMDHWVLIVGRNYLLVPVGGVLQALDQWRASPAAQAHMALVATDPLEVVLHENSMDRLV